MTEKQKVLVVDDEKHICENVKNILAKNDFEVEEAHSAQEALEKMGGDSFSLLISDMVMPNMNGLELVKQVKEKWPSTKALIMTAYASTDTAVKAIQLGALDYITKPFTPEELREIVNLAVSDKLAEAPVPEQLKERINVIDIDLPFDADEVAKYTGEDYVKNLSRSDMPVVEVNKPEHYCEVGQMVCEIFKKMGKTCKAGVKKQECPQKKSKAGKAGKGRDVKKLIGVDMPFNYDEVVALTGPEYVANLQGEFAFMPYEELKQRTREMMQDKDKKDASVIGFSERKANEKILVIDDEPYITKNVRKILAKEGYEVEQATTKQEALEQIKEKSYDLVLLDLKIPGVKGMELLKVVREHLPEARVIIITGYASIESAKESARLGVFDYLHKPFTPEEIRDATENAMNLAA
ncbi:MAG: response regulator [Desulfobacteraceae bacterium]|nr:response regulator [Desulfobacteraceae bacterium]